MKAVALVGMPGSGKSEVARIFVKNGYRAVRFGDITDEEVGKRELLLNEANERAVREELRQEVAQLKAQSKVIPGLSMSISLAKRARK